VSLLSGVELLVATGNVGKMAEFRALLGPYGNTIHSLVDLGLDEPEETEFSFVGNALLKARAGAKASGLPTLADDSGLTVEALGGAPGIYTADWAETSSGRNFTVAMTKTWELMSAIGAPNARQAEFRCVLAVVWPTGEEKVFVGQIHGKIVWPKRGNIGHGYDPIFQPDDHIQTMGELSPEVKNRISHRANAFGKLILGCFT
jgi:XTP/dITP diphosphohydrolase